MAVESFTAAYELVVLLAGLALLTALVYCGQSIFVAAPFCAGCILAASGFNPLVGLCGPFMTGFADFLRQFYLVFALGAAFGKLMDESGAATTIARAIVQRLGASRACLAVVLACAALTYGGVSLFVVGFSVYPLAVHLFRQADLPRRFIPGAIAFGSVTFTMTSAGSPEIQNLIPMKYLIDAQGAPLTDARAGWPASLIVAGMMFLIGQLYLEWAIRRGLAAGERFRPRPDDSTPTTAADERPGKHPALLLALLPLLATLAALNFLPRFTPLPEDPTLAIFAGVAAALACLFPHLKQPGLALSQGFVNGLLAAGSTCSVVGFGSAMKELPAFTRVVDWVTHLPGDPLIGAALAVAVIAAIAGSASGGQGLALPLIKPIYVDQLGVAPRALHRVVSIASGSLDSLPANGYLVMLIRNICGETHRDAYGPIFVTTVLVPLLGTAVAIGLFRLVPAWGTM